MLVERTNCIYATIVFCCISSWSGQLFSQLLDASWIVTVNGQSVTVDSNGSFRIPNIAVADQFGSAGPGSPPDFLGDDFLRAIGVSNSGGKTRYAFSEPFQIRSSQTYVIRRLTITDSAPPFPSRVRFDQVGSPLTAPNEMVQLKLTGFLADNSEIDVTPRAKWTSYRTSNPAVANVGPDGKVTAGNQSGFVFITGVNEAAAAVTRVIVALGDPLTTVEGFVLQDDGTPVPGATVEVVGLSNASTTGADGGFSIPNVPTSVGNLTIQANANGRIGTATGLAPVGGGITDAGIIRLAPPPSNEGDEFMLVFQRNIEITNNNVLFISGKTATTGEVDIPGLGFSRSFSVTPGEVASILMPPNIQVSGRNTTENKGISVTADDPISIYGLNQRRFSTDAFTALPTGALGQRYRIISYEALGAGTNLQSHFAVVAHEDDTTVTIIPSVTTSGRSQGVPFNITLNRFQVYQLGTDAAGEDLTGTLVSSNKPVGVFGGAACVNVPRRFAACDHLVEHLPPVNSWGQRFITLPLSLRRNGDTFRILADSNETNVQIIGPNPETFTLGAGEHAERILTGNNQILADKPVLLAQYSNGQLFDNVLSDPFMMIIPPAEQFLEQYTFATPGTTFVTNFVNIAAPTADAQGGRVLLDGSAIPANQFTDIPGTGFSCAKVPISVGSHTVSGDQPLGIYVYGFASADSYGYPGGIGLRPSN